MSQLVQEFEFKVGRALSACATAGVEMRPYYRLRTTTEQAKLWRQSRPKEEIEAAVSMLQRERAPYLARCLVEAGAQSGKWATNALPGQSWHQWGEAVDCAVYEHGKFSWSAAHPGYELYARAAKAEGLEAGYYWQRKDAVHIQFRVASVRSLYSWEDIDRLMLNKFENGDI